MSLSTYRVTLVSGAYWNYLMARIVYKKMGRITAIIPDELEKQLRLQALEVYGGKKGDLSKAVENAIKNWVTSKK